MIQNYHICFKTYFSKVQCIQLKETQFFLVIQLQTFQQFSKIKQSY